MSRRDAGVRAALWLVAAVAVAMFVFGVVSLVAYYLGGGREASSVSAGASLVIAGATTALGAGSFVTARYLRLQIESSVRPVLVLDEANNAPPVHNLVRGWFVGRSLSVRVRNLGPGSAHNIAVAGWVWRNRGIPPTFRGSLTSLGTGGSADVQLWLERGVEDQPETYDMFSLRIVYEDTHGRSFVTPTEGALAGQLLPQAESQVPNGQRSGAK